MIASDNNVKGYSRFIWGLLLTLCFLTTGSVSVFAEKQKNPPGPRGGAGAGPAWRDNPNRIDNPPGLRGGRGTDWDTGRGNPPGAVGGPGAGPRWKDNPNFQDNPPGLRGGLGTDWGDNPPGPRGGEGTDWNPPGPRGELGSEYGRSRRGQHYHRGSEKLEKMRAKRDELAAQGADPEKLAKIDEKIANRQAKLDEWKAKHDAKLAEQEATQESEPVS